VVQPEVCPRTESLAEFAIRGDAPIEVSPHVDAIVDGTLYFMEVFVQVLMPFVPVGARNAPVFHDEDRERRKHGAELLQPVIEALRIHGCHLEPPAHERLDEIEQPENATGTCTPVVVEPDEIDLSYALGWTEE